MLVNEAETWFIFACFCAVSGKITALYFSPLYIKQGCVTDSFIVAIELNLVQFFVPTGHKFLHVVVIVDKNFLSFCNIPSC